MRPLLSICIPTFRRAQIVYNTVLNHLEIQSEEIEVVVCDNCSPDNTIEMLSRISDSRLRVYQNDVNRGFHYNLSRVIKEAKGHFACLMSDEDGLDHTQFIEVLRWIKEFVDDNYEIGALIPGSNGQVITKREELLQALYGRVSYMSGIIINRDILIEEDFNLENENDYPHVQLVLLCGTRGRVVFSPYNLIIKMFEDNQDTLERVKLNSKAKTECNSNPYTAESRSRQFSVEKNMILNLNISKETKYALLLKQYRIKTTQATIIYELYIRSKKKLDELGIERACISADLEYEMGKKFIDIVTEELESKYAQQACSEVEILNNFISNIRKSRMEFDKLTKEQRYVSVIAGNGEYIVEYLDELLDYDFKVDYMCMKQEGQISKVNISIDQMINFEKVVVLVDGTDMEYINLLESKNFKDAHLFYIQDLYLKI